MSMTGFGAAESAVGSRRVRVEIRTVNHRFFNLAARLPTELLPHETAIRDLLRGAFERGHIAVTVQWVETGTAAGPRVDTERAVEAKAAIQDLRDRLQLAGEVTLDQVLRFPDVIASRPDDPLAAIEWEAIGPTIVTAAESCRAARAVEGAVLGAEIATRLAAITGAADQVERQLPGRLDHELARLRQNVNRLIGSGEVSGERLATEVALLADRVDVTEELTRLRAHVAAAQDTMAGARAVGKRLGFLAQELGREVNTIGSKANDAGIAHLVVDMKSELEKVREQLENLE